MINWFPGHMNKTLKQMQSDSKLCDCFIYVLDARCPNSCLNPEFIKVVKDKPIIFVLNKADLVNVDDVKKFKSQFESGKNLCVSLNSTTSGTSKTIVSALQKIFKDKILMNKSRGVNFIFRAMVLGIPNSGKSTLVNNLCNKARAVTGNRAGVTKSKQWVKVDDYIEVMDTPGVLLPDFEDEKNAYNLAIVGSVKDEVLNLTDIALTLIEKLKSLCPLAINTRYGINANDFASNYDLLLEIGKKRGCSIRGGEIDIERTAKLLLMDFRSAKLGKICLE